VNIDTQASADTSTNTSDNTHPDLVFAAAGDFERTDATRGVIDNIKNTNPTFVFNLGDFAYDNGESAARRWWDDYMRPLHKLKQYPTLGNHDILDQSTYLSLYGIEKWTYSFTTQNVFILCLNTEETHIVGSTQWNYAKESLRKSVEEMPNIKWRIVLFHKPIYCSEGGHQPYASFRDSMHPVFDQFSVDLVLSGHSHNYERSYPLGYNQERPDKPKINNTKRNDYFNPLGQIYTVIGTGGRMSYPFDSCEPHFYEQYEGYGFLKIKIEKNGTVMSCRFHANDMSIQDRFSITKA
jgi:acid phosphatase type 7